MMMKWKRLLNSIQPAIVLAAFLGLSVGCGQSGPRLSEVTGVITIDGQPVNSLMVEFAPADGKIGAARAFTDEKGRYRLQYNRDRNGATLGTNRVSFLVMDYAKPSIPLPQRYTSSPSELIAEVTSKGPNEFNFNLTEK